MSRAMRALGQRAVLYASSSSFFRDMTRRDFKYRLRRFADSSNIGIVIVDLHGGVHYANRKALAMCSHTAEEIEAGKLDWKQLTPPEFADLDRRAMQELRSYGVVSPYEKELLDRYGRRFPVMLNGILIEDGEEGYALFYISDLTDRKRQQQRLLESEERLRLALEAAHLGTWDAAPGCAGVEMSAQARRMFGFEEDEPITCETLLAAIHPEDRPAIQALANALGSGEGMDRIDVECRIRRRDGAERWLHGFGASIRGPDGRALRSLGVVMDVTARKTAAQKLAAALAEKETLLREIHHRVKNNLQSIWGMIQFEITRMEHTSGGRQRLEAIANRLVLLGRIHERLYQSGSFARVAMHDQIRMLVEDTDRFHDLGGRVALSTELAPLYCDLTLAVPLILITNELLSNALKHAFPSLGRGEIVVALRHHAEEGWVELQVSDTGVGSAALTGRNGIGLTLVRALAGQIDASFDFACDRGCTSTIRLSDQEFSTDGS